MDEKKSLYIQNFLDYMREAQKEYKWSISKEKEQDDLTQDILHLLELEKLGYHERARLSAQLSGVRKERRKHKDAVEELEPVIKFMENNRKIMNELEQVLGSVRKMERYHDNRSYHPKVLKEGNI